MAERKIRKKDCVRLSNKIIQRCDLSLISISSIEDIKSNLFIGLLQVLCGPQLPPGITAAPTSPEDEINNVQAIINHLALDLINVDLNHITGAAVIAGDPRAIYNLLEIFCGLHKYLSSTSIDKWNLEESLTETEEELSSTGSSSSSSEKATEDEPLVTADDGEAAEDAEAEATEETPPAGRPPSGSRASPPRTGSGSAGKRRSSETTAHTSSGSVAATPSSTSRSVDGSTSQTTPTTATSDTTGTTSSSVKAGDVASGVSFPESQFSLENELPMSPTTSKSSPVRPEVHADLSGIIPADITPSDPGIPPDSPSSADSPTTGSGETGTGESKEESGESEESSEVEHEQVRKPTKPFIPRHFDFADHGETEEQEDETEDEAEEEEEEEQQQQEDISQELSDEMHQLKESTTEKTSSGTEPTSESKELTPPTTTAEPTTTSADDSALSRRQRGGRSAPSTPASKIAAASRLRRRLQSDCSSVSDPGVGQRVPGRRLLTRNIETIAEIHESGGERATCQTTREQAGDKLCKEVTRKEVRRKVHSAPQPTRLASYCKQSSRRSVCSDGVLQWLESQADDTYLKVQGEETDVFEFLRREFPYVHVSEETKRKLLHQYRQQMKYIMNLTEPMETRKYKIRRQDVLRRQSLLTDIVRQQKMHDKRFQKVTDQKRCEIRSRNVTRDTKIACLRAERYVDSFKQQFQSRMALNKSREELLLKAVFEEMLEIQRHRLRTVRRLEKDAITDFYGEDGYTADLNRMHQFYEANFRDLSQLLSREKQDLKLSEKQQLKLADKIRREFREYMEADVRSLNDKIVNSWQPQYRELDADRIRSDLYQANWKFCVT